MRKCGLLLMLLMSLWSATAVRAEESMKAISDAVLSEATSEGEEATSESEESLFNEHTYDWSDEVPSADTDAQDFEDELQKASTKDAVLSYNEEDRLYRYSFPNQCWFETNVPNGGVSTDPVRLHFDKNSIHVSVQKDNEAYDPDGYYRFTEPGSYEFDMMLLPMEEESDSMVIYEYHYSFQILEGSVSRQAFLTAPDGYEIGEIRLNGKPVSFASPVCTYLTEDGRYQVRFSAEGLPDYRLSFRKDTAAPVLRFNQTITKSSVSLPMTFEKAESSSEVAVYRDGVRLELSDNSIPQGGWYQVRVSDAAGNSRCYQFYVKQELSLFDQPLRILLGMAVVGSAVLLLGGGWSLRKLFQ